MLKPPGKDFKKVAVASTLCPACGQRIEHRTDYAIAAVQTNTPDGIVTKLVANRNTRDPYLHDQPGRVGGHVRRVSADRRWSGMSAHRGGYRRGASSLLWGASGLMPGGVTAIVKGVLRVANAVFDGNVRKRHESLGEYDLW